MKKKLCITSIIIVILIGINFKILKVCGSSMSPTIEDGDMVLVSRVGYIIGKPSNQDIVIFKGGEGLLMIKRIVGIPKDFIRVMYDGNISINPENDNNCHWVPNGKYFVIGDNKKNSIDSRNSSIKYIDETDIIGKIIYKW